MLSLREAWGNALVEIGTEDTRLVVIDPDVGNSSRADIFGDAIPERYFHVGIAEQNAVGMAAGMASLGMVPWLSTFSPFLSHRSADQIRMLIAQCRSNVKLAGTYTGLLTGLTGRTHQDVQDIAIMRAMPDMVLLSPADPTELMASMRWAQNYSGPVYFRIARDPESDVFDDDYRFELGKTHTLRDGSDVTIVSTSVQTPRCLEACELLAERGISAKLVHVPTLKPLADSEILDAVSGSSLIVSVEDHSIIGGLGSAIAEALSSQPEHARLHRIGLNDVWTESAPNDFLLDKYNLSAVKVAEQVAAELANETIYQA
jgi:transketolase